MPNIIHISSLDHPLAQPYSRLTEAQLRHYPTSQSGIFIAESPKVILTALNAGYRPLSLLCEQRHIQGDATPIIDRCKELDIITGSREMLAQLTGYTLTRGVLCAMHRPVLPKVEHICAKADCIAVIDGVCDTTNIGAIFRSAAALGIDALLLTPTSCDPLNRRAVRVSMGSVFLMPWTWTDISSTQTPPEANYCDLLRTLGFTTIAMALSENALSIDDGILKSVLRKAIILGTEGDGLSAHVVQRVDYVARIPMSHGVDSLNVAAASAVAFWQLLH